jgi:LCP family protein required for cell wall assembly
MPPFVCCVVAASVFFADAQSTRFVWPLGRWPMKEPAPPRLAWEMWKHFLLAGVIIVSLTATATATAVLLQVSDVANELAKGPKANVGNELTRADVEGPQTIMLLGSDHDAGQTGNSDTLMLVRLDPDKAATAVMSIPRDLKVDIYMRDGTIRPAQKINAAYAFGGVRLSVATVKRALGIDVNHVINIDYGGFRHAVDRVGCIYTDVDRRYFNDNSQGGEPYAQIDLQPGYQKLCNYDALSYVRYRHTDTDIVRGARQQDFLRQAKDQLGAQKLFDDREALVRIFAHYAVTDIRGTSTVLGLAKLAAFSAGHPIRQVHFRSELGPSFVYATPGDIRATVREFLNEDVVASPVSRPPGGSPQRPARRARQPRRARPTIPGGLEQAASDGEDQAIQAGAKVPFAVYYPTLRTAGSVYDQRPRTYTITDLRQRRQWAYRMVLDKGTLGDFYGIEGMTWKNPPILTHPTGQQTISGRRFDLYGDGGRLRFVAWRTLTATYWLSNTLTLALTNDEMLAIAASTRTPGH